MAGIHKMFSQMQKGTQQELQALRARQDNVETRTKNQETNLVQAIVKQMRLLQNPAADSKSPFAESGRFEEEEDGEDQPRAAAQPLPSTPQSRFWVLNVYDLDVVNDFRHLNTPSKSSVIEGNRLLYKAVVKQGRRVLVPYPLDEDGDWLSFEDFDDHHPVLRSLDYVAAVIPSPLFTLGRQGWLSIVDLLESQECKAIFDPPTGGTYIQRLPTPSHTGSFQDRTIDGKRPRTSEMGGSGNGDWRSRARQRM